MSGTTSRDRAGWAATGPSGRGRAGGTAARVVGALVASCALGLLTAYGQTALPFALERAANSTGAWTLIAFAVVWWSRARPGAAALLGVASFLLLNVGYAVAAAALRGDSYEIGPRNYWVMAGFLAGPLVGVGAAWLRHRQDTLAALGIAGLSAVLIGDAYDGVTLYPSQSPVYWVLQGTVGVVLLLCACATRLRGAAARALSLVATLVVAVCFHQATLATVNGVLRL
jgi:hypothetical protein